MFSSVFRTIVTVLVASATTLFIVQNLAPMEINFLTFSLQAPRFVCVVVSLMLGVGLGVLWRVPWPFPRRNKAPDG